jgi:Protein of unknown function (DUF2281)
MSVIERKKYIHYSMEQLPTEALPEMEKLLVELRQKYQPEPQKPRQFGFMKGLVAHMSDDFDEPLPDFEPYMH